MVSWPHGFGTCVTFVRPLMQAPLCKVRDRRKYGRELAWRNREAVRQRSTKRSRGRFSMQSVRIGVVAVLVACSNDTAPEPLRALTGNWDGKVGDLFVAAALTDRGGQVGGNGWLVS